MLRSINWIKTLAIGLTSVASISVAAQPFTGTNSPNTGKDFTFTLGAGATNLSLLVSNSPNAYSYLLLKKGGIPTDSDFDYVSRLNGQTNQISLESPEFTATNYGVRVFTPSTSLAQAFSVSLQTNHAGIRSATNPVVKPIAFAAAGSLNQTGGGAWHYFQVDVPTNLPGWRLVLSHSGTGNPNLYVRRNGLPTTSTSDKSSTGQLNDTIVFTNTEATNSTYFVGVHLPAGTASSAAYTLTTELGYLNTLGWDPGTSHEGTQVFTNTSSTGGEYYFKITAQGTTVGSVRAALKVTSGEADLFMRRDTFATGFSSYNFKQSTLAGSDGFVLAAPEFSTGQDLYFLVRATPGAQWTLMCGEAHVLNLGPLAAAGSSATSTNVTIGPEGMRFFQTTVPVGTLAWRLGLNGATNELLVRKNLVPSLYSSGTYDLKQATQMLVVPTYLTGGTVYYVGVPGAPNTSIDLDCRQQSIVDLPFITATNFSAGSYGYATFRVQVPVQQIAWMTALDTTLGDANLSIRRGSVANEWNNDAFSEVAGLANESVLLVPPSLSDGTFFVTVYGKGAYTTTFSSGNPIITDVPFAGVTTNDNPTLAGWRLYRVPDINSQLGYLGWELFLSNQPVGTEIALRRNAVPGRWNYRAATTSVSTQGNVDYTSTAGFLQRQDHAADIWYVGVYNPSAALNQFILDRRTYAATNVEPVGANTVVDQPANQFRYFQIDVPAGVLGWDLRITNVTSGDPRLIVRRDRLPDNLISHTESSSSGWSAAGSVSWPSTYQWAAGTDWTGYSSSPTGVNESGRILAMGMGNPLEPGTYYVGVTGPNGATTPLSYELSSRFIGPGQAIVPTPLALAGGSATISNLAPRDVVYYAIEVPTNTSSMRLRLSADAGESTLLLQKDVIPNVGATTRNPFTIGGGTKISKAGEEFFTVLSPTGQTNLPVGTYYAVILSEGMNPTSIRIGTNSSTATLSSLGELPVLNLGALGGTDLVHSDTIPSAELKAFQFTLPSGLNGVELRLENRVGNPKMSLRMGSALPSPTDNYGNYGGQAATWASTDLIYLPNPASGTYTLMIQAAAASSVYAPAGFTIRLHAVESAPLAFDGGTVNVVNQPNDTWKFFSMTVPSNAFGWDLRLTNVVSGDPRLVVRRGLAPFSLSTLSGSGGQGWGAAGSTSWPVGYQWAPSTDYTGYTQDANSTNRSGHTLTAGMGNPLEPGDYIIGVYTGTGSGSANPMTYTLSSRGIGAGFTIPIQSLAFAGGSAAFTDLFPRDFKFYSLVIPSNTPSWKLTLATNSGDSLVAIQKDALPNIGASASASPANLNGGYLSKKSGNEVFTMLPAINQSNIAAGTYYLAVVSEGMNPTSTRAGTNASSGTLTSLGSVSVNNLGTLIPGVDITSAGSMPAAELQFYQFSVDPGVLSMQLRLTNRIGNPKMTLRRGSLVPKPTDSYGSDGGSSSEWSDVSFIDIPNPTPGLYTLTVQAGALSGIYVDASFTILLQATGSTPLAFDGGTLNVTNQPSGVWKYFYVTIPTNTLGWDLRIRNVTSGDPRLVVRRDQLPTSLSTLSSSGSGWGVATATSWPASYQWAASADWTDYANNAVGTNETGHIIAGGMGSPLSPGNYYVGVFNGTGAGSANPMSYTLASRGIGSGYTIPIADLGFEASTVGNGLPVRETAYYRINIASNVPSWKLRLSPTVGQAVLTVNKASIPCILAGANNATQANGGRRMQRLGDEFYLLLPAAGQTNVPAGDYYVGVTSEGMEPTSTRSGTNSVNYVLTSLGSAPVDNLGTVGASDLLRTNQLTGGDVLLYQFSLPPGVPSMEVSLENVTGGPKMTLRRGANFPAPKDDYGNDGGELETWEGTSLITIANPIATNYALAVQVPAATNSATFTVRVHGASIQEVNFAQNLNTNGLSHTVTEALGDNQRAYYRVVVPATNNSAPVIGWRLNLSQSTGSASLRARKNLLPSDADSNLMPFTSTEAVLVPPFLTPGTWYVEVKATGSTTFTMTSSSVELERSAWDMPMVAQPSTTPGLVSTDFGDSGVQTNGVALPGDRGVDVNQGGFHYYGVDVPEFNGGIMRVVLEAISGNPDFYLRYGALPTVTHGSSGTSGSLHDRLLNASGTEYANWVAIDGKYEKSLTPGRWYVAVRASGNSNARYRLRLSTGNVEEIPLHGASLSNQVVAAKDFRYYRVVVPTNAPTAWQVSFNQQIGDVLMYVRDTTPPGQGDNVTTFKDWSSDNKNNGPYSTYDASGTYTLNVPPLRPGHTYFLGFRGITDGTFSLTTSSNGNDINVAGTLDFYNGSITNVIPAFGKLTFRMDVPSDARRIRYTNSAPSSLKWYLEQGTLPALTSSDDWTATGSVLMNQAITGTWPWMSSQMYFLTVTNTSGTPQSFNVQMDGRNCVNDDNDNDGLPDCWELTYFASTSSYTGTSDPDNDGNSNLVEYQDETNPTLSTSMLARLTILTSGNGSATVTPNPGPYPYGTMVTLTATADTDYIHQSWTGSGVFSTANPLTVAMTTNRTVTASFIYDYGAPGLTRADYRFTNSYASSVGNPPPLVAMNTNQFFTNMVVNGITRSALRFASGSGLNLQPTATVFPTNVYTVAVLFRLDTVSGYRRLLDTKNAVADQGLYVRDGKVTLYPSGVESPVCISSNTWHHLVLTRDNASVVKVYLDGTLRLTINDTSSYAVINAAGSMRFFKDNSSEESAGYVARIRNFASALSEEEVEDLNPFAPFVFTNVGLDLANRFQFTVSGPDGVSCAIQGSANLTNWSTLTNIVGFPGVMDFDLSSAEPVQFLRVRAE